MLMTLLAAALLAAAPTRPIRLASPGLTYVNVEEKVGDFFVDYFAQQVVLQGGIRVTTKTEVGALLGFERQKELLGCSDKSSSCLAELAGALGVDGLITGSLAKLGSGYAINIKVVAANDGRALAAFSKRMKTDDQMLDWLAQCAEKLAVDLRRQLGGTMASSRGRSTQAATAGPAAPVPAPITAPTSAVSTTSGPTLRERAWIPLVSGGVVSAFGLTVFLLGKQNAARLYNKDPGVPDFATAQRVAASGRRAEVIGMLGIVAGIATMGAAGGMYLWGDRPTERPAVTVVPIHGGAAALVSGAFP